MINKTHCKVCDMNSLGLEVCTDCQNIFAAHGYIVKTFADYEAIKEDTSPAEDHKISKAIYQKVNY